MLAGWLAGWLLEYALGFVRAVSFGIHLEFIENQLESALGCLRVVSFKIQLEFNRKSMRIWSGLPQSRF